jgi:hypothetical protein
VAAVQVGAAAAVMNVDHISAVLLVWTDRSISWLVANLKAVHDHLASQADD